MHRYSYEILTPVPVGGEFELEDDADPNEHARVCAEQDVDEWKRALELRVTNIDNEGKE